MKKHPTSNIQRRTSNLLSRVTFDVGCWIFAAVVFLSAAPSASAQSTETQFLSGHGKDDAVPWKFFCTSGANSGFWTNLPVPSQWDMQGFGTLNYHKDQTNAWSERGLYEHDFTVSADWAGKRIFLVFDGVMTDTDAKLNGQSVGPVHQGSFYQFKYEVTPLVKFGATNRLEVTVSKHSANESVNRAERLADYWVFGGIFRPVSLEAVPPQFIERVAIDAKADGSFSADVFLNGVTNADEVEAQIQTLDGKNVWGVLKSGSEVFPLSSPKGGEGRGEEANTLNNQHPSPRLGGERENNTHVMLHGRFSSPNLWTAETPNLYRVEFRLKQHGQVIHQFTQRFGFRTFEVRAGDGLYLNGRRVILKGANRHSFWPDSGRCLSEAVHRLDIATLKDANMNAVRMSHYPPDAQFLDLCDELGLYVLDELGGWQKFYDDEVGAKLVREMVLRDVNHPAILFWDNGNEGGFNTNLDHLYPKYDPQQRRVLHPWATFSGINTSHYLAYDKAEIAAGGQRTYYSNNQEIVATNDPQHYIYMPTEFLHGLYDGGAGAGLDDYWRMMTASQYLGGGFIWALMDEGVKRPDTGAIDVAGNQAPDGIVGPYRQREGSFYTVKEIWCPIQAALVGRVSSRTEIKIENHYSFTDAGECRFTWELRKFPAPTDQWNFKVLASGTVPAPKIAPGQTGLLQLSLPALKNADALHLRVDDPGGRELWTWVWPLKSGGDDRLTEAPAEHRAAVTESNGLITVTAGDLTTTFSKTTGLLTGVQRGAQTFSLANGPRPAVGSATLREIHFTDDGPDAVVSAKFDGDLKSVVWRVNGNGWVNCDYTYAAHGTNDFFGVLFDYPENFVLHKRWLGDGPFRVWQNRLRGVTPGIWENDYNNTLTGYRDWIYPEFKGCFANWRWLQLTTKEGPVTLVNQSGVPFVQVLTPDFGPDKLKAKAWAPMPACGLGLLDAIPALGSKFKEAKFSGPQGQPAVLNGEISGAVSFYFGPLP